jgi:hypothetical protein
LGGGNEEEDADEEEGEVTPHPHYPPPEDFPSPDKLFSQQEGISVGVHRPNCLWTRTGASSGPPPLSGTALVSSNLQGMSIPLVMMGIAHLLEVL